MPRPFLEEIPFHKTQVFLQVYDDIRRLRRRADDLPPALSQIVNLLCDALNDLIEAEWRPLRTSTRQDKGSDALASLKGQAIQRLETAVRNLQAGQTGQGTDPQTR